MHGASTQQRCGMAGKVLLGGSVGSVAKHQTLNYTVSAACGWFVSVQQWPLCLRCPAGEPGGWAHSARAKPAAGGIHLKCVCVCGIPTRGLLLQLVGRGTG